MEYRTFLKTDRSLFPPEWEKNFLQLFENLEKKIEQNGNTTYSYNGRYMFTLFHDLWISYDILKIIFGEKITLVHIYGQSQHELKLIKNLLRIKYPNLFNLTHESIIFYHS